MNVEFYLDEELIGHAVLDAWDPPMGVAGGPFEPAPGYKRGTHASVIEGVDNPLGGDLRFKVQDDQGGTVECQAIWIEDYSDCLGERQVSVLGIPYPEYENRFGEYSAYKAYQSET